jgi:hypothetical protein
MKDLFESTDIFLTEVFIFVVANGTNERILLSFHHIFAFLLGHFKDLAIVSEVVYEQSS